MDPGPKTGHHHPGRRLSISAAAGSGKTAVLTERVLTIITDPERPVDIDRLLIVTFSNAAAEEMRQRIAARLYERMEQEPENAVLRRQSLLLGNAEDLHHPCLLLPAHPGEFPGAGAARRYGPGPGWGGRAFAGGGAGAAAG